MRRDDFPLKTSHVLLFDKEEYPDFFNDYLAKNKEENLEAEQRAFASLVGTKVSATYARSCIFNTDETAVYYDATPTRIISERGAKKSVKIRGPTTSALQPLDVGVMGPLKQKLRAITLAFELGAVGPSGHLPLRERLLTIERMSALEKRKRLVERVIAAWDAVSKDTIKKAWLKAGL
ncbi:DDE superfamily endonuclease [Phytophthora infestans]|uniref:DDE superfamily endonuclease n=1 Tax=Phytophthora infestans TaxID=4787 RepID=A0A833X2A2_PHYIN|nr:DDE superfamily endonuclease [Phytophthora infestans]